MPSGTAEWFEQRSDGIRLVSVRVSLGAAAEGGRPGVSAETPVRAVVRRGRGPLTRG